MLDQLSLRASTFRVARAGGVESEMQLAYAGLHQLCAPMLDHLDSLPAPQRDALATALGLMAGPPPDRFFVGLAVLSLLDQVAELQPLLCLVDDAHWLDDASAQTLAFVARRLLAEPIVMVFGTRPVDDGRGLGGLPQLPISGLPDADARALLQDSLPFPLDKAVLDQILAECRGNPLALVELPRAWANNDIAGGFAISDARTLPSRIEDGFRRKVEQLPDATRLLLLTAAVEPSGDRALLWRAADALGLDRDAATPAEAVALIEFGTRIRFRHPLVRSTVQRTASILDVRRAHAALAEASDPLREPDRHAWHRAQATPGPDGDVADALESSAGRAQARGGLAAAAAFLDRAVDLTPDPARRATRALAGARAKLQAGAPDAATALLTVAEDGPLSDLERAHAALLRGQLAFISSHGRDAPPLLLAAARQFEPLDRALARDTYLDALAAALYVGRLGGEVSLPEVAAAGRTAALSAEHPTDLLLDGLTAMIADGYAAGAPRARKAVADFRAEPMSVPEEIRWLWLATHAAHDVWDDESWEALCERHLRLARQAGALTILPIALSARVGLHLFAGELRRAASLVEELAAVTTATGSRLPPYGALQLAAYRGRQAEAEALIEAALDEATSRGEGMGLTIIQHAQAVLYNGLGRYDQAREVAEEATANPPELAFSAWSLVQLVEAAARSGQDAQAGAALDRLTPIARASGTNWALGVEARSRALLEQGEAADRSYLEAIERLGRTRLPMQQAHARLLYGEWLRRERRRADAREQLGAAHQAFSDMGAEAFAQRAHRELASTGARVRARSAERADALTAQEAQIARLAAAGLTNPEIGTELFLSPHTVEWHLRKVFAKLRVSSRRQLHAALPPGDRPAVASA